MADNPIKHSDIIQPGDPFKDTIDGLEKLLKLLKETAKEYKKFATSQSTSSKEGRKNIKNVTNATNELSIKEKEAIKIKKQLEQAQAKLALAGSKENKQLIKTREAIRAKNAEMRKAAKAQDQGAKSTNRWGKALGSFAFKFNALGNIASNVASRITRTFSRAMRGAIKTIMDFEQAMADVRSITNATDKDFKALSKSARDLGGSTKFTAIEVAKLQKEYAKLGFATEEILKVSEATLNLAAATGTDLARAAEVTGITIRQFGLDASQTTRVVDVMTKSFSESPLDMERFAEAMKMVGPAAAASGISLETTTAMMMQLAEAGIFGSMAGTSLRGIMLGLAKTSGTLSEKIAKVSKNGLDLAGATEEVQRRAATALIVLGNGVDTLGDYEEALAKAAGTAERMADTQLDTLQNKVVILKSAWDRLILSLASSEEQFIYLKAVIDGTSSGLNAMSDGVEGNKEEQTKFNKALENSWKAIKRSIPIWGGMAMQQEIITAKLLEQKEAADKLKESFTELVDGTQPVVEAAEELEDVVKPDTLKAFSVQLKDLQEQRENASLSEIGAINREIAALDEKIKKYKEAGALLPSVNEIKDFVDEEIVIEEIGYDKKKNSYRENLAFRKRESKRFAAEDKAEKEKQLAEEKRIEDEKQSKIQATFELANRLTSTFTDLFESQKQKELSAVGDNAEKRAEIEKKYAKKQQILSISQAVVDGASSILKTKASLGLPLAIPFMIADAALTAVQIGIIAAQKFGEGEVDISGPSHSRGGINAEIEGGESVINKRSTTKYRTLLEAINANDSAGIANAALQNEAFHEVWGRTKVNEVTLKNSDPWTRKLYEAYIETPVVVPDGARIEYRPGKTRIVNG